MATLGRINTEMKGSPVQFKDPRFGGYSVDPFDDLLAAIHRSQISVAHNSLLEHEAIDTAGCKGKLGKFHKFRFKTSTIKLLSRAEREKSISTCRTY